MKNLWLGFKLLALVLLASPLVAKDSTTTADPQPTPTLTFKQEKQKLELERLQLENEKIKLENEKMKFEATKTVKPAEKTNSHEDRMKAAEAFAVTMTLKAEALAKENKDKDNLVVVDFANAEIWNKGVRYEIHQVFTMAEDEHLDMKKKLDEIAPRGANRDLFIIKNLSLLKYDDEERGIFKVVAPAKEDDFKLITPDGLSFDSSIGDVRNASQNDFFHYEGDAHDGKLKILRYIHNAEWKFSDRLEFTFDKDGKLVNIRFGVLEEH